ncbi:MAG: HTTM domain-containing protein [Candidatus Caenarcaniphilales bacterium]|nr:HTTM domain-containing protein [Candidatus Caenarcaniphilales bacterium]
MRLPHLELLYSDIGVLSRKSIIESSSPWIVSLNLSSGTTLFQFILFLFSLYFAISLIIGYKTFLSTLASWILILSWHNRNPFLFHSGDQLLQLLLFWSLFIPLGKFFSIDSIRQGKSSVESYSYFSVGSIAIICQIFFVYFFTSLHKIGPEWVERGSAVYYALNLDTFVNPLGKWLLNFPLLLHFSSYLVFAIELFIPFLIFIPFFNDRIRLFVIFTFISFHFMLGIGLSIGLFSIICSTAWLLLLPKSTWEYLGNLRNKHLNGVTSIHLNKIKNYINKFIFQTFNFLPLLRKVAASMLCGVLLAFVLMINLNDINSSKFSISPSIGWIKSFLGLKQEWKMFSPYLIKEDFWAIMIGETHNGEFMDLEQEGIIPLKVQKNRYLLTKPKNLCKVCKEQYLGSYSNYICIMGDRPLINLAEHSCLEWNSNKNPKIKSVQIFCLKEKTLPNNKTAPIEKKLLLTHKCK